VNLGGFEQWSWYVNVAATCALLIRLCWSGLFREYRLFFLYLLADFLHQILALLFLSNRNRTAELYMGGQTIKIFLTVLVILELCRLALARQPALARFAANTAPWVFAGAATLAVAGLAIDPSVPRGQSPIIHYFQSFERTMDLCMLISLLLLSVWMMWFPVRMKRNAALYLGGFVVFFVARSAGLLWVNLVVRYRAPISGGLLTVSTACLLVWLFAMRRKGEETTAVIGHRWNPAAIERLTGQLESINAGLETLSWRKRP
jgi:hypothetical protein